LLLALAGMSAWLASRLLTRNFAPDLTLRKAIGGGCGQTLPATQDEANGIEICSESALRRQHHFPTVDFDFFFNACPNRAQAQCHHR
jgi:hypothetical protein